MVAVSCFVARSELGRGSPSLVAAGLSGLPEERRCEGMVRSVFVLTNICYTPRKISFRAAPNGRAYRLKPDGRKLTNV